MTELERPSKLSDLAIVEKAITFTMPSRTRFQVKNFVVDQHDTPEMQFKQIMLEIQDLTHKIRYNEITLEKMELQIRRLRESSNEMDAIKVKHKLLAKERLEILMTATYQELDYFIELASQYPEYTAQDIEAGQEKYWNARLSRQAEIDRLSSQSGVGVGNLQSLLQAKMLTTNGINATKELEYEIR